ncbi:MAG: addiction module antidote protein, HigA family [Candidatus Muproteobacteria bacterium RBG_19FT_COMBO_61_10]|jgi:addiction module HigA family antidote|uniref:Addiction module antidote protein, HigA family n=1 Tax=Candidatus Muproteobacteria bacterium RBG_19FT_COMBO_61_10 TaxID=1817761 RepID=A0A1F6UMW2_9PROT|nr:MAG: addiction module antidote protein, HigA family [Candidatus Muproteobacteria bacterium RBG_19FT_COMBO_61_10]
MQITERQPFSPGEILKEEFMDPLNLTQGQLADWLDVERRRINEIIRGKREVTPDTAVRLGKAFGVSPQFWLSLQMRTNLWVALQDQGEEYVHIKPITDGRGIAPGDTTGK